MLNKTFKAGKGRGKGMGRDPHPIDWDRVELLIKAGCSGVEIAGMLGCIPETFYERYNKQYNSPFSAARASKEPAGGGMIRLRQFQSAMQGNTRMLELLGKERLGQGKNNEYVSPNDANLGMIQDLLKENKDLKDKLNAVIHKTDPFLPARDIDGTEHGRASETNND